MPGSVFPCTAGARLDNATIDICTIYIYIYTHMCMNTHHWLNKLLQWREISCKPGNVALLSTSINKN